MKIVLREKRIGQFFRLSIWLKGIHAALEVVSGMLLIFLSPIQLTKFVVWMTQDELLEEPNDLIANYLLDVARQLSVSSLMFGAFYLLSHGIVKLTLVIALLKKKLWAYPWSLALFSLFIVYQIYRLSITYSLGLFVLTLFDLMVIWLIWREYKIIRKRHEI
jgi:uncharacterized membrane protein